MPPDALPALVSTAWLTAHLSDPDLRVVDATWYLPHLKRDARTEHRQAHVPGAVYFDIDEVKDTRNPLPHMLPAADEFARAVGALGIGSGDRVVIYGGRYGIASARAWWTFRVFGHEAVAVLDGGLPKWRADGRPLQAGEDTPTPRQYTTSHRPELVRDLEVDAGQRGEPGRAGGGRALARAVRRDRARAPAGTARGAHPRQRERALRQPVSARRQHPAAGAGAARACSRQRGSISPSRWSRRAGRA